MLLAVGTEDSVLGAELLERYRSAYGDRLHPQVFDGVRHAFETVSAHERLVELTASCG